MPAFGPALGPALGTALGPALVPALVSALGLALGPAFGERFTMRRVGLFNKDVYIAEKVVQSQVEQSIRNKIIDGITQGVVLNLYLTAVFLVRRQQAW